MTTTTLPQMAVVVADVVCTRQKPVRLNAKARPAPAKMNPLAAPALWPAHSANSLASVNSDKVNLGA